MISILWICLDKQISFTLKNLSSSTIKINWDNVCYIDESNESSGVIHKGIRYMDAGKPMAASAIPKDAELSDLIAPTNKVYYNESEERLYSLSSLILKLFSRAFCRFFLPVLRIIYAYT